MVIVRTARPLLALVVVALAAACGDGRATSSASLQGTPVPVAAPLVGPGQVAVVRGDRSVVTVSETGAQASVLAKVPAAEGEPDAVAVSADGRLVLVSAVQDDDDSADCSAAVLQVLPGGELRRLAEGASLALTADGSRLAYFRYDGSDGACRRSELVVRDLADGADSVVAELEDGVGGGTPPEWPVSWSPDGTQVAHVTQAGAAVTTVATGQTQVLPVAPGSRALAPAWLGDGRLVALHGCCVGSVSIRDASSGREVFPAPGPLRSLRPDRRGSGAWFTVEEQGLHRWNGAAVRQVFADAPLTSG